MKLKTLLLLKLLILIVVVLRLSGYIRFGEIDSLGADEASPTEEKKESPANEKKDEETAKDEKQGEGVVSKRKSFLDELLELPKYDDKKFKREELNKYLQMADRKEKQISTRIVLLQQRESQLQKLEHKIEEKIKQLDEEKKFIVATLQREKTLKGERIERLRVLYQKMEPKKAAAVFEKIDRDLFVDMVSNLPEKQITQILEAMPPDKSAPLTEYYGRVRSAKEYELLKEMNKSLAEEFNQCKGMPDAK